MRNLAAWLLGGCTAVLAGGGPALDFDGLYSGTGQHPGAQASCDARRDPRRVADVPPGAAWAGEYVGTERGSEDFRALYRTYAPSVVVVLTANGHGAGTGFLATTNGWFLTAAHVVDTALLTSNLTREVTVLLGAFGPDGRMNPVNHRHRAELCKIDYGRDLAALRITDWSARDPAARIVPLPVSHASLDVGDEVVCIGHRAIGRLWGMKHGAVVSHGTRRENILPLMEWEKTRDTDLGGEPISLHDFTARTRLNAPGAVTADDVLLVETSCPTSPGDSGGPLLNRSGELVGVASFSIPGEASAAYYFIHPDEVRAFTDKVYARPTPPPLPHETKYLHARRGDANGNGVADHVELFNGGDHSFADEFRVAVLWDLDENANLNGLKECGAYRDPNLDFEMFSLIQDDLKFVFVDWKDRGYFNRCVVHSPDNKVAVEWERKSLSARWTRMPNGKTHVIADMPSTWRAVWDAIPDVAVGRN